MRINWFKTIILSLFYLRKVVVEERKTNHSTTFDVDDATMKEIGRTTDTFLEYVRNLKGIQAVRDFNKELKERMRKLK